MKKLMTLAICLFAFIGITRADDDKPVTVDQLPQKAQAFIKQYFADKQVSLAKQERDFFDKSYEVMFVNGEKVEFDKNGEWKDVDCKFSEVPADIIPQAIRTHIASPNRPRLPRLRSAAQQPPRTQLQHLLPADRHRRLNLAQAHITGDGAKMPAILLRLLRSHLPNFRGGA